MPVALTRRILNLRLYSLSSVEWSGGRGMNSTVLKLILKRFVGQFSQRMLAYFIVPLIFIFLLCLIMYVLTRYECPVRRAVGYPSEKPPGYRTYIRYYWEHNCDSAPVNS
jgi:hypothetical protein